MSAIIRKIVTVVEETYLEMGRPVTPPTRRAAGHRRDRESVCRKICRGSLAADCIGEELGELLAARAVAALGIEGPNAQSYGKAAAVAKTASLNMRQRSCIPRWAHRYARCWQGRGADSVIQEARWGRNDTGYSARPQGCGVRAKPLHGMEVQINDAPRANEIMVALAVTDSGRPLPRVGGLTVAEIKGEDGLR